MCVCFQTEDDKQSPVASERHRTPYSSLKETHNIPASQKPSMSNDRTIQKGRKGAGGRCLLVYNNIENDS